MTMASARSTSPASTATGSASSRSMPATSASRSSAAVASALETGVAGALWLAQTSLGGGGPGEAPLQLALAEHTAQHRDERSGIGRRDIRSKGLDRMNSGVRPGLALRLSIELLEYIGAGFHGLGKHVV